MAVPPSTFWDHVLVPGDSPAPAPEQSDTFTFADIPHSPFWKSVLVPGYGVTAPDYSAIFNVTDGVSSPSTSRDSVPASGTSVNG